MLPGCSSRLNVSFYPHFNGNSVLYISRTSVSHLVSCILEWVSSYPEAAIYTENEKAFFLVQILPHTGWTIGVLGFDCRRGLGIFLFTTASRTALGPSQPPVQWVSGSLSLGVKGPGREADNSPPSSAEVKEWVELYFHSPNTPSWRYVQLRKRTGTTLPLPSDTV